MRGDYLHTRVLVAQMANLLRLFCAIVKLEHYTRLGESFGYVDILACLGSYRIVCEAELSPDRVHKDVEKALALRANLLLIVVPEKRLCEGVKRRLKELPADKIRSSELEIWVLPLGPALQRLRERCLLMTGRNVPTTSSHQIEGERA